MKCVIPQLENNDLEMGAAQASYMYSRFQKVDYFHTIASYDFIMVSLFILSIFKPISNFTYLCHNSLTLLPCKYAFVILTFLLDLIASKGACTLFGCCAAIRQICLVILSSLHLFCSSRAHHYGSIIFLCFQDPKEGIHF